MNATQSAGLFMVSVVLTGCATMATPTFKTPQQIKAAQMAVCPDLVERRDNIRTYVDNPLADFQDAPEEKIARIDGLLEAAPADAPYLRYHLLKRRYTALLQVGDIDGAIQDLTAVRDEQLALDPELNWIDRELELLKSGFTPNVGGPEPKVRIPPRLPIEANKSGRCVVQFNIEPEGSTSNVQTLYCTDDIFVDSAINSVAQWTYEPSRDGATNARSTVRYVMINQYGCPLPE